MEYLDHPFDVATASSRRPTPKEYEHLRKWAAPEEKYLRLTSSEEITNLAQQFDETDIFNVSNIFQRALSFIFGQTDLGPRIIKGTLDGALHVAIDGLLSDTKNLITIPLTVSGIEPVSIITGETGFKIHVVNLMFTVVGDVNIILKSGAIPLSGSMEFGGTNQPSGMVAPLGIGPIVCNSGEDFVMLLSLDIATTGFVTYFKQIA